jgi:hypothetical protein
VNIIVQFLSNTFFLTPFCIVSKWNNLESIIAQVLLHQKLKPTKYNSFKDRQDAQDAQEKQNSKKFMQRDSKNRYSRKKKRMEKFCFN